MREFSVLVPHVHLAVFSILLIWIFSDARTSLDLHERSSALFEARLESSRGCKSLTSQARSARLLRQRRPSSLLDARPGWLTCRRRSPPRIVAVCLTAWSLWSASSRPPRARQMVPAPTSHPAGLADEDSQSYPQIPPTSSTCLWRRSTHGHVGPLHSFWP